MHIISKEICMKCQILFSMKYKKNNINNLSSAELAHSVEMVNSDEQTFIYPEIVMDGAVAVFQTSLLLMKSLYKTETPIF